MGVGVGVGTGDRCGSVVRYLTSIQPSSVISKLSTLGTSGSIHVCNSEKLSEYS